MVGLTLAERYRLAERIGSGGMADVYRARQLGAVEREVAVKLIHREMAATTAIAQMFSDEARLHANLRHAKIVRLIDFGVDGGQPFIVMDYVRGCSLSQLLKSARGPLSPSLAMYVGEELCDALDYAHNLRDAAGQPLGLVHRDISTANVLVSDAGEVLLSDFGIARWSERRAPRTGTNQVKGNLQYLSPEQAAGDEVDARTDLYMVGVVLYHVLTGQLPFRADALGQLVDAIRHGRFAPVDQLAPSTPPALVNVVHRLMASAPDDRYPDARVVRAELSELLGPTQPAAESLAELVRARASRPQLQLQLPPSTEEAPRTERALAAPVETTASPPTVPARPSVKTASDPAETPDEPSFHQRNNRVWIAAIVSFALVGAGAFTVYRIRHAVRALPSVNDPPPTVTQPPARDDPPAPSAPVAPVTHAAKAHRTHLPTEKLPFGSGSGRGSGSVGNGNGNGVGNGNGNGNGVGNGNGNGVGNGNGGESTKAVGWLELESTPWAQVRVDGQWVDRTPIGRRAMAPGKHHLALDNLALGLHAELDVDVAAGATAYRFVNLVNGAVRESR